MENFSVYLLMFVSFIFVFSEPTEVFVSVEVIDSVVKVLDSSLTDNPGFEVITKSPLNRHGTNMGHYLLILFPIFSEQLLYFFEYCLLRITLVPVSPPTLFFVVNFLVLIYVILFVSPFFYPLLKYFFS